MSNWNAEHEFPSKMDPRKEKRRNHRSLQEIDDFLARQRTMAIAGFFFDGKSENKMDDLGVPTFLGQLHMM